MEEDTGGFWTLQYGKKIDNVAKNIAYTAILQSVKLKLDVIPKPVLYM